MACIDFCFQEFKNKYKYSYFYDTDFSTTDVIDSLVGRRQILKCCLEFCSMKG